MAVIQKYLEQALKAIRPNAKYDLDDLKAEGFNWKDDSDKKPSLQELKMAYDEALVFYKQQRREEYPSPGDQLDAIWKGGQDMLDMKAKIDAIKAKYPKP